MDLTSQNKQWLLFRNMHSIFTQKKEWGLNPILPFIEVSRNYYTINTSMGSSNRSVNNACTFNFILLSLLSLKLLPLYGLNSKLIHDVINIDFSHDSNTSSMVCLFLLSTLYFIGHSVICKYGHIVESPKKSINLLLSSLNE
ncbi:hypothetical protein QFZ78_007678 [Paenibacillus sp. V4I5]|nr:hypothetical protein [Paenibacillus sp. V4I5]